MKSPLNYVLLFVFLAQCDALDNLVDLGRVFDENSVHWPITRPFEFTKKDTQINEHGHWSAMNEFACGEHVGTHLDAPYHFNKNGWKVGDIPLERLIGPGVYIDLQLKVLELENIHHGVHVTLTGKDIYDWEILNGNIQNGSIVLVNFGWGQYYGTRKYLYNKNANDVLDFPGISEDAAEILVERGVAGVGVDTSSIDNGDSETFDSHRVLLMNNIFGLENLDFSTHLPANGFNVIVMPMKIKEGTGAPVRVIAAPEFRKKQVA